LKSFQLIRRIHNDLSSITKAPNANADFSRGNGEKSSEARTAKMLQCCHIILYWDIIDEKFPVCCSIFVKEKPSLGSPLLEAVFCDLIPKATKGVCEHFLIHSSKFFKL
jgi:hypothetical protein